MSKILVQVISIYILWCWRKKLLLLVLAVNIYSIEEKTRIIDEQKYKYIERSYLAFVLFSSSSSSY